MVKRGRRPAQVTGPAASLGGRGLRSLGIRITRHTSTNQLSSPVRINLTLTTLALRRTIQNNRNELALRHAAAPR